MKMSNAPGRWLSAILSIAAMVSVTSSTASVAQAQAQAQAQGQAQGKPPAQAQNQKNNRYDGLAAGNATMEIAKAEGKLEAQQGQRIKISTAEQMEIFIDISQETSLKYSGEADRSWLSPGLMVRFSTKFDQGKPEVLKGLEVFMPVMHRRMSMEQIRDQTPGMYQEGKVPPAGAKGLFAEDDKKAGAKPAGKPSAATPPAAATGAAPTVRVIGKLMGVHGNVVMVMTEQPMQFELDPEATIAVTSGDLSFVAQGDSVAVSGLRSPAEPSFIRAERIEIKAAKKLTQPQPAPRGGRTRTNMRGKAGDAAADKDSKGTKAGDAKAANGRTIPKPGDKPTDDKTTKPKR